MRFTIKIYAHNSSHRKHIKTRGLIMAMKNPQSESLRFCHRNEWKVVIITTQSRNVLSQFSGYFKGCQSLEWMCAKKKVCV